MTIRQKTLLLIVSLLLVSLGLTLLKTRTIFMKRIEELECHLVRSQLTVTLRVLEKRVAELAGMAAEWGEWDRTWLFMAARERRYLEDDLLPAEFQAHHLEHVVLFTPEGNVRHAASYDRVRKRAAPFPPPLLERLRQMALAGHSRSAPPVRSGIMRAGRQYYFVAIHPVLTTAGRGPDRGSIIVADEVEPEELGSMAEMTGQPFSIVPLASPEIPPDIRAQLLTLPAGETRLEYSVTGDTTEGVALVPDLLTGEKIVILLHYSRAFFRESSNMITYYFAVTVVSGIILSAATFLLIGRIILAPLDRLNRQLAALDSDAATARVELPGGEELDNLARTINKTMERLHHSEEQYRHFIQNFNGIAFQVRPGSGVVFLTGAVIPITGYIADEIGNRAPAWREIIHPDDRERFSRFSSLLLAAPGTPRELEYRIIHRTDGVRWVHEMASASGNDADGTAVIEGAVYDITDRKVAEEALLLAKDEAERANRTKSAFLATMSHELRTPLTAILGLAESVQEQGGSSLTAEQCRSLRLIETSGYHLLSLINDLLDLSRIEADRMEFFPEPVSLAALCQTCLRFVEGQAAAKRMTLSLDLDGAPDEFTVDSRRLTQILTNLLSNAVKFTPAGGAGGIRVAADREAGVITFTVWDTGIGIRRDDLDLLFVPFKQVDSALSRDYEGTGLGLALVSRLAELQGGAVTVESQVGIGSRFTVSLPLPPDTPLLPPDAPAPLLPVVAPGGETTRGGEPAATPLVLLAEDNDVTREMTMEFLKGRGYRVCEARNGVEALAEATTAGPDLIVMDVQMPGIDGLEAIRLIRELPGRAGRVPIIALTALVMAGDRERCLAAGATHYFGKPIRLRDLCDCIDAIVAPR